MVPVQRFLFSVLIALLFTHEVSGIQCYVCKSDENAYCTSTSKAPGKPVDAVNCSNPHELITDWITNHDFMKYTFADMNLEKIIRYVGDETVKEAGLKEVTACAYFMASTENVVTAEVDKDITKVRSFFKDAKANQSMTIKEWVMRDCVTLKLKQNTKDALTDHCFPFPGSKKLGKLYFCMCTADKCNLPTTQVKGFIKHDVDETTSSTSGRFNLFFTDFLNLALAMAMTWIYLEKLN